MSTEKKTMELTEEKFQEIYKSEKFRNEVASAHWQCDKGGRKLHKITCSYPITYKVTEGQVKEAQEELKRAIKKAAKENTYKLLFIGMGSEYSPRYEDDVCNFRIRTEFLNPEGKRFFIEFGTGRNEGDLRIDHAIDRDLEIKMNEKASEYIKLANEARKNMNFQKETFYRNEVNKWMEQPYNNYKGLEHSAQYLGKYTKENLLKIVNENFGCNFKELVIDNYNLSCDGVICESPKQ